MMRSDAVRGFIANAIERQKSQASVQPANKPQEMPQPAVAQPSNVQQAAQNFANIFQQNLGNQPQLMLFSKNQPQSVSAMIQSKNPVPAAKPKDEVADTSMMFKSVQSPAPQSNSQGTQSNGLIRRFMPNPSLRMTK